MRQPVLFVGRRRTLEQLKYIFLFRLIELAGDIESALAYASSLKNPEKLESLVRSSVMPSPPPATLEEMQNSVAEFAEMAEGYIEGAEKEKKQLSTELEITLHILELILEEEMEMVANKLRTRAASLRKEAERWESMIKVLPVGMDREAHRDRTGVHQYTAEATILENFAQLLQWDSPQW